jgi:hypothetical protein
MKLKIIVFFAMSASLTNFSLSQELSALVPGNPSGWSTGIADTVYNPESLYDYIDGGAELYISYGMKEVISRLITNENGDEIRIEIFDMGKAKNAFGVFTHSRTENEGVYGQGSQYFPGTQIFWKDKYYVSVMATDENESIRSVINNLASEIENNITSTGEIPGIVSLLPEEDLEKDGFTFFHHYIWLNSYYYIADDNFLGIDDNTNAIIARYGKRSMRYYLLIIEYADAGKSRSAFSGFRSTFLDPRPEETIVQIEDGTWLGGISHGNYLICVFNAPSKADAGNLIDKTINKTQP